MTWILWIILAVIFWFTIRFSPAASWLNLDFRRAWDPRNGHPNGGEPDDRLEEPAPIPSVIKDPSGSFVNHTRIPMVDEDSDGDPNRR